MPRGPGRGGWALTTLLVVASVVGIGAGPAAAAEFVPVDAPVVRGFEEPAHDYGPGHRGIDFALPVGTEVVASAAGVVQFAGPVAGAGAFVSLSHP
ncbi:MAG: M23 family metallopeptidase, partial [Actinomycetota bacterium]